MRRIKPAPHSIEVMVCGKHMLTAYITNFGTLTHTEVIKKQKAKSLWCRGCVFTSER